MIKNQLNLNYDRNILLCWLFKFLCKIIVKFTIDLKFVLVLESLSFKIKEFVYTLLTLFLVGLECEFQTKFKPQICISNFFLKKIYIHI